MEPGNNHLRLLHVSSRSSMRSLVVCTLIACVCALAACTPTPTPAPAPVAGSGAGDDSATGASASAADEVAAPGAASEQEPQPAAGEQSDIHPGFEGGVHRIGPWLADELTDRNWHRGCPVGIEDLRVVHVSYWSFHGDVRAGPIVVNESQADGVLWVFRRLFRAEFPIHRVALPHTYRPPRHSDWFSTRNRTYGFNCRPATGNPGSLSHHSYGWAIDINPLQNPYIASDGSVLRKAAKSYVDRSQHEPGMIHPGDVVVRSFAHIGWEWGGDWVTIKDYMHFSLTGR